MWATCGVMIVWCGVKLAHRIQAQTKQPDQSHLKREALTPGLLTCETGPSQDSRCEILTYGRRLITFNLIFMKLELEQVKTDFTS